MCKFSKRQQLTKEDLEEIVNYSADYEFSDDSRRSYDSDMSPKYISRPISGWDGDAGAYPLRVYEVSQS